MLLSDGLVFFILLYEDCAPIEKISGSTNARQALLWFPKLGNQTDYMEPWFANVDAVSIVI